MNKRVLTTISCTLLIGGVLAGAAQQKNEKPNIIFLLADDMRYDAMRNAGNTIIQTPEIDRLAQQGTSFRNAFVTTSICCCSRASILSGQYVARHGIVDFSTPFSPDALKETYPLVLRENGYQTGFIGKYGIGNNTKGVDGQFDYFWGSASQPFYNSTDENGKPIHYTDLVGNHIAKFLETTDKDKPFCLSVSFKAPHVQDGDPRQFIYNPRYNDLYASVNIPEEPTNTIEEWHRFPDFFRQNNEARRRWWLRFSTGQQYQESLRGYFRLIKGIDDVIGQARKTLEEMGIADNTIIIFTSDNGFFLGEHGLAGKWYGHEPSIRVPLIIYDPRNKEEAPKKIEEMALNIDIAPTILSLAGAEKPSSMQGKDLLPVLKNNATSWRESFYYEHMVPLDIIPKSQGYRNQQYKYLVYPESNPIYEELYDLKNDPAELNNLALDKHKKEILNTIRKQFKKAQFAATTVE
tara:strand:- start:2736 stop:4127 length:1392 start_codon:yes stop_codon:yes gene_type:complete